MRADWYELRYRSFGWRWLKALLWGAEGGWLRLATFTIPEVEVVCEWGGPTYDVTHFPPLRAALECIRCRSKWPWRDMRYKEAGERTLVPQRFTVYAVSRRERSKRDMARWDAQRAVIEGALMAGGTIKWDGWNNYLMPPWAKLGPGGYRKIAPSPE